MRYGVFLTNADLESMEAYIREGNATLISQQSRNRSLWLLPFEGKQLYAVYDRHHHTIATFLSPEMARGTHMPSERLAG